MLFIHRGDVYTTGDEWEKTRPGQEYTKNLEEIIVAKHQKGPTRSIRLEFVDNLLKFESL